jgi:hypothetical protein
MSDELTESFFFVPSFSSLLRVFCSCFQKEKKKICGVASLDLAFFFFGFHCVHASPLFNCTCTSLFIANEHCNTRSPSSPPHSFFPFPFVSPFFLFFFPHFFFFICRQTKVGFTNLATNSSNRGQSGGLCSTMELSTTTKKKATVHQLAPSI